MRILKLIVLAAITLLAVACTPKKEAPTAQEKGPKVLFAEDSTVLVLYYSLTSHTKAVAEEIAKRMNADIEEIALVEPYDTAYQATIDRCKADREKGILPKIKPLKSNIADYDVVFIGYPIWFGTYALPIASLLDKIDLSDKWVVPFCTFGSGGLESSAKDMAEKQPNAKILPGYGVRAARMDAMPKELENFLNMLTGGPCFVPADFPEQHPVNADEAAIFDAAVKGYKMLNATASAVASRTIPEGTEYLFTAQDVRRDVSPNDSQLTSEIQIYVTVENGKAPEFTRVVR